MLRRGFLQSALEFLGEKQGMWYNMRMSKKPLFGGLLSELHFRGDEDSVYELGRVIAWSSSYVFLERCDDAGRRDGYAVIDNTVLDDIRETNRTLPFDGINISLSADLPLKDALLELACAEGEPIGLEFADREDLPVFGVLTAVGEVLSLAALDKMGNADGAYYVLKRDVTGVYYKTRELQCLKKWQTRLDEVPTFLNADEIYEKVNSLVALCLRHCPDRFYVGECVGIRGDFVLLNAVDPCGERDGYLFVKRAAVSRIECGTQYLKKLEQIINLPKSEGICPVKGGSSEELFRQISRTGEIVEIYTETFGNLSATVVRATAPGFECEQVGERLLRMSYRDVIAVGVDSAYCRKLARESKV